MTFARFCADVNFGRAVATKLDGVADQVLQKLRDLAGVGSVGLSQVQIIGQ